jgi:hypothetical protein
MDGPEHQNIKYEGSSVAWINDNKKNISIKEVLLNKFFNQITDFYFTRNFKDFTYCPIIVFLLKSKNNIFDFIKNWNDKYFYHLEKSNDKIIYSLDNNVDMNNLDKGKTYTVVIKNNLNFENNNENIIIDKNLPSFVINQILLDMKEKCGSLFVLYDDLNLFFENSTRTYSDFLIFDEIFNEINESNIYLSSIRLAANLIFNDNFIIFDKTSNWTELKSINKF